VVIAAALVMVLGGLAAGWATGFVVRVAALICITAILGVSLTLINGVTGQFSIGHAGFMIVGAYAAGLLTSFVFRLPDEHRLWVAVPVFLLALCLGGVAAGLLGLLVGLPTLRLRGDYLAIATIGFAEIIGVVLKFITFKENVDGFDLSVGGPSGFSGLATMPGPALPGIAAADQPVAMSFVYSLLALAGIVWLLRNFITSSHGRACGAIRDDEIVAEILGVDTTFYKVSTFVMGAFFAGIGGGLLAHWSTTIHPSMGGFLQSVKYLIVVYVGGVGSLSGAVLAAALLEVLDELLKGLLPESGAWRMVAYGAVLVGMILWRPRGLYGGKEFRWLVTRRGGRAEEE